MDELKQYIAEAMAYGLNDSEIKQALLDAGWDIENITQAFAFARLFQNLPAGEQKPIFAKLEQTPQADKEKIEQKQGSPKPSTSEFIQRLAGLGPRLVKRLKSPLGLTLAILILVLGGGVIFIKASGFDFQSLSFTNPDKFWQKFLSAQEPYAYTSAFNFIYDDTQNSPEDKTTKTAAAIKFSLSGKTYLNYQELKNPQSQSRFNFTLDNAQGNLKGNLEYRLLGQTLYLNIGDTGFLNAFIRLPEGINWLKVDLRDASKDLQNKGSLGDFFANQSQDELKNIIKQWRPRAWLTAKNFVGKEELDSQVVWHYQADFNKTKFLADLQKLVDELAKQADKNPAGSTQTPAKILSALADKFQVANLNLWIGDKDRQVHKLELASNFLSIAQTAKNLSGQDTSALFGGSDSQRLADLTAFSTGLELYFNDKGGYPKNLAALQLNYLAAIPAAKPASGICKDAYNAYAYQPQGTAAKSKTGEEVYPSYSLVSCLGSNTGTHQAGLILQNPQGLTTTTTCPAGDAKCFLNPTEVMAREEQQLQSLISDKISFAARLNLTLNYSDFNRSISVVAPGDSTDLLEFLKNQFNLFIKQEKPVNLR